MKGKRGKPLFWAALAVLAVLVTAAAMMTGRTASLSADVRYEQSLTPTPVPTVFNVMQVTPDPSLPTPDFTIISLSAWSPEWKASKACAGSRA